MLEQCPADDPDTEINLGCLLFKVTQIKIIKLPEFNTSRVYPALCEVKYVTPEVLLVYIHVDGNRMPTLVVTWKYDVKTDVCFYGKC